MKNYNISENYWKAGDGWYLDGGGHPYMNDFQNKGAIANKSQIFFPFPFQISEMYDVNLIFYV